MKRFVWLACLLLAASFDVRADEIRLKDGSRIVGEIVDFEDNVFKVRTAYGFAMVRKDSIAQIIPSVANSRAEVAGKGEGAKSPSPLVKPAVVSSTTAEPRPAVSGSAASSATRNAASEAAATPVPPPAKNVSQPQTIGGSAAPAPGSAVAPATTDLSSVVSAPIQAAATPAVIRESIQGNLYTNESYGMQFFHPPGWNLIPEARKSMPTAITAMGTSDETTLFIVGREPLRDSLEAHAVNAERALEKVYENYRQVSSTQRTLGGLNAVQWQFRGVADGHDWSVTELTIVRGSDVFTVLGMTYADSDLIQIRENVIARMIASLQFSAPQ
jgi:hypothetical protein